MKSNLKLWNAGSSQDRPRTKETHLDSIGNNLVKTTIFTFLLHWAKVAFNPIVEEIKIAENTPMIVLFLEKANCQFREHYRLILKYKCMGEQLSILDSYLNINVWEKNWVFWFYIQWGEWRFSKRFRSFKDFCSSLWLYLSASNLLVQ